MRAADDTRPTHPADLLDVWLAEPAVRTHHRSWAEAAPDALWTTVLLIILGLISDLILEQIDPRVRTSAS